MLDAVGLLLLAMLVAVGGLLSILVVGFYNLVFGDKK